jgi:5-formyltetrahydrofolate cyclo-ligase
MNAERTSICAKIVRERIWDRLRPLAKPDARFHLDFAQVIPDFEGSADAIDRVMSQPHVRDASYAFVTPDNVLSGLRRRLLETGKTLVVATHDIRRGFYLLDPKTIPAGLALYASWLDGLEHFGQQISLAGIAARGRFDFLVTGASAVSIDGTRFGKGHAFFDLEWGMFSELGLVDDNTPVIAVVHDAQVVEEQLYPSETDIRVDAIATPTRYIELHRGRRPRGIQWPVLDPEVIASIPPLQELQRDRGLPVRRRA